MTYYPNAVQQWIDNVRRFANYRNELIDVLKWLGETAVEKMRENHPPGGPHPGPGETPVYGEHAYIDRTQWLTDSIAYTLEAWAPWDPKSGTASALPTLTIVATAPHADAVEFGVPGHSRAYPFFWNSIEELLPQASEKLAELMRKYNAMGMR
jgi:hypothetical protein